MKSEGAAIISRIFSILRLTFEDLRRVKASPTSLFKLPKVKLIASPSFEKHSSVFAEAFVAQMSPKENSTNIRGFQPGFEGFRNFYDFADFRGISSPRQALREGTTVSSAVL